MNNLTDEFETTLCEIEEPLYLTNNKNAIFVIK